MDILTKLRIGCFALTGILLLAASIFFIGFQHLFQPKVTMFTVFYETVQGLSVGSPVKFGGVEYGRVTDIDFNISRNCVYVTLEIYPDQIFSDDEHSGVRQMEIFNAAAEMKKLVDGGLYCHIALLGITGLVYVETDFNKSISQTLDSRPAYLPEGMIYIPSMRSVQSDIIHTARELIPKMDDAFGKLNQLDVAKLNAMLTDMQALTQKAHDIDFATANGALLEFKKGADHFRDILERYRSVSDTIRLNAILDNTAVASERLNSILNESNLPELHANLTKLVENISAASATLGQGREDFSKFIPRLTETLTVVDDLLRRINENPTVLLRGEQPVSPLNKK